MTGILAAYINAGIAGAVVTFAVWLALSIASRRWLNATTRYAVWWTTLLVVVMLPVFYLPHRAKPFAAPQPFWAPGPVTIAETAAPQISDVSTDASNAPVPSRWPQFQFEFRAGPSRVVSAWGIVVIFMLLRLGASYVLLERRKRRARPAENLQCWPVRALISNDIASPMAAGLFRPCDPASRTSSE